MVDTLRRAVHADIPFLITAIEAAESCDVDGRPTTYEQLFSLSRNELEQLLRTVLAEETVGHQLTSNSFFIMERDDRPIAACAAWIEGEDGVPSGFKTATLLSRALGMERWMAARSRIRALAKATPARTPGALQLETFYVDPAHRGSCATARLIHGVRAWYHDQQITVRDAEIILLVENAPARKAYERAGFVASRESVPTDPLFTQLTGSRGFVQLRSSEPDRET